MPLLSNDRSFVPHWSNRRCWTFSDPSANCTLRNQKEPIVSECCSSLLSDRSAPVSLPVRHSAVLFLLKKSPQRLRKQTRSSPVAPRHTPDLKGAFYLNLLHIHRRLLCFGHFVLWLAVFWVIANHTF